MVSTITPQCIIEFDPGAVKRKTSLQGMSLPELCKKLQVNPETGIAEGEANKRRETGGSNEYPSLSAKTLGCTILETISKPRFLLFLIALIASGGLVVLVAVYTERTYHLTTLLIIIAEILILFVIIGIYAGTEYSLQRHYYNFLIEAYKNQKAVVRRNGRFQTIPASEVVVGDCISLQFGDTIPADGVLITEECDENSVCLKPQQLMAQSRFMGDKGQMIVTAVGSRTQYGMNLLAEQNRVLENVKYKKAPFQKRTLLKSKLTNLLFRLFMALLIIALVTFIVLSLRYSSTNYIIKSNGFHPSDTTHYVNFLLIGFEIILSALPEGLLAVFVIVTSCQALIARMLLKKKIICKNIETLGNLGAITQVTCSQETLTAKSLDGADARETFEELFNRKIGTIIFTKHKLETVCALGIIDCPEGSSTIKVKTYVTPGDQEILIRLIVKAHPSGEGIAVIGHDISDSKSLAWGDVGIVLKNASTHAAASASNLIMEDIKDVITAFQYGQMLNDAIIKFLQYHLTVNLVIIVMNMILVCIVNESLLNLDQICFINVFMACLVALIYYFEVCFQIDDPKNCSTSSKLLIPCQSWITIIGMAVYQFIILFILTIAGNKIFTNANPRNVEQSMDRLFVTFIFMCLFNVINSRSIYGNANVLKNFHKVLPFFLIIVIACGIEIWFNTNYLSMAEWVISIGLGASTLLWGQVMIMISKRLCKKTSGSN